MKLTELESQLLEALEQSYMTMLRMPMDSLRIRSQSVLATARDAIAVARGGDAEDVQNFFEERVRPASAGDLLPIAGLRMMPAGLLESMKPLAPPLVHIPQPADPDNLLSCERRRAIDCGRYQHDGAYVCRMKTCPAKVAK